MGGFRLGKCASNDSALLNNINIADHGLASDKTLQEDNLKILGISWNTDRDIFQFQVNLLNTNCTRTRYTFLDRKNLRPPRLGRSCSRHCQNKNAAIMAADM